MAYLCSHNIPFPIGFIVRATVSFVILNFLWDIVELRSQLRLRPGISRILGASSNGDPDWGLPRVKYAIGECNPTLCQPEAGLVTSWSERSERSDENPVAYNVQDTPLGIESTIPGIASHYLFLFWGLCLLAYTAGRNGQAPTIVVYVQFCGSSGRGSPNCRCYWSVVRTATLRAAWWSERTYTKKILF